MTYTPENNPYIPGDPYSYDLKWIVAEIKHALELYEPLHDEITDLHDYVINYFANLDLTAEVSAKINEMAEDGSLAAIIQPLFDEYEAEITGIVSAQNDEISVLSARMDTFASLTQGSTTGDAELQDIRVGADGVTYATAGDAVRAQIAAIDNNILLPVPIVSDVQQGSISGTTGGDIAATNRYRTNGYIQMQTGDYIEFPDLVNYKTFAAKYNATSHAYISNLKAFGSSTARVVITEPCAIRFAFGKADDSELTNDDINNRIDIVRVVRRQYYPHSVIDSMERGSLPTGSQNIIGSTAYYDRIMSEVYETASNTAIFECSADVPANAIIVLHRWTANFNTHLAVRVNHNSDHMLALNIGSYKYFAVTIIFPADITTWEPVTIYSQTPIYKRYLPNKQAENSFMYAVNNSCETTGRLILPANYTNDGPACPLIVYVHGSQSMLNWNSNFLSEYLPFMHYLANEGFAIFDCYPWTDKITGSTYSPVCLPLHKKVYIEGIKFVCKHFNVDSDNVALLCKSQGGNLGHWACTTSEFNFKAVGLFAPTTDPRVQRTNKLFYNSACRAAIAAVTPFKGTQEEIDAFISSGDLTDSTVRAFISKNKSILLSMLPLSTDINGYDDYNDVVDDSLSYITTAPDWQLDDGAPSWDSSYDLIPAFAAYSDKVRHGRRPVKFWCAFDDASTSTYGNYALYRYLLNGGTDADFRTLPNGTGGHHAMDTAAQALKTSGTTRLGIAYTDMPTAYVEYADFLYNKMIID